MSNKGCKNNNDVVILCSIIQSFIRYLPSLEIMCLPKENFPKNVFISINYLIVIIVLYRVVS